jgi:hypothetical protein
MQEMDDMVLILGGSSRVSWSTSSHRVATIFQSPLPILAAIQFSKLADFSSVIATLAGNWAYAILVLSPYQQNNSQLEQNVPHS